MPDVQLLKDFYDQAGMEVLLGKDTTAGIFMDTDTAQGSALSSLLFILFINALLRLFDGSGTHHGVKGAPHLITCLGFTSLCVRPVSVCSV